MESLVSNNYIVIVHLKSNENWQNKELNLEDGEYLEKQRFVHETQCAISESNWFLICLVLADASHGQWPRTTGKIIDAFEMRSSHAKSTLNRQEDS